MDARIVAEPMAMAVVPVRVKVVTTIQVADLVRKLVSLFDPATILAPLLAMGNSVTAVAPDFNSKEEVSGWAMA